MSRMRRSREASWAWPCSKTHVWKWADRCHDLMGWGELIQMPYTHYSIYKWPSRKLDWAATRSMLVKSLLPTEFMCFILRLRASLRSTSLVECVPISGLARGSLSCEFRNLGYREEKIGCASQGPSIAQW